MPVVVLFSDTHCGSTIGLLPPQGFTTDDGQVILPSAAQRWLWEKWEAFWKDCFSLAVEGEPVIAVVVGDLIEGYHHQTTQLITDKRSDHESIFLSCVKPWKTKVSGWYIVRGTPVHVGQAAASEERIGRLLGACTDPAYPARFSFPHLRLEVENVRLDIAHHRGGSHRAWTRGNPMRVHVLQTIFHCVDYHLPLPHLVVRAHQHRFEETNETISRAVKGLGLGGWQLKTEFVHRIAPDSLLADIGGYAVVCREGKYKVHRLEYLPESRTQGEEYLQWMKHP
jgi:hypothetical protein